MSRSFSVLRAYVSRVNSLMVGSRPRMGLPLAVIYD